MPSCEPAVQLSSTWLCLVRVCVPVCASMCVRAECLWVCCVYAFACDQLWTCVCLNYWLCLAAGLLGCFLNSILLLTTKSDHIHAHLQDKLKQTIWQQLSNHTHGSQPTTHAWRQVCSLVSSVGYVDVRPSTSMLCFSLSFASHPVLMGVCCWSWTNDGVWCRVAGLSRQFAAWRVGLDGN